jgi:hypothetical protein
MRDTIIARNVAQNKEGYEMLFNRSPLILQEPGDEGVQPVTEDPVLGDPGIMAELRKIDQDCSAVWSPKERQYANTAGIPEDIEDIQFRSLFDQR